MLLILRASTINSGSTAMATICDGFIPRVGTKWGTVRSVAPLLVWRRSPITDAVAVAMVHVTDSRARLHQVVLEVVHVPQAVRHGSVPVRVVRVRSQLIVGVVVRQPARIPRQCRTLLRAVPHHVVGVAHRTVHAVWVFGNCIQRNSKRDCEDCGEGLAEYRDHQVRSLQARIKSPAL